MPTSREETRKLVDALKAVGFDVVGVYDTTDMTAAEKAVFFGDLEKKIEEQKLRDMGIEPKTEE